MSHDQPSYANLPGIRVFGMKCVAPSHTSNGQPQRKKPTIQQQHRVPPKQPGQSTYHYLHRPDNVVHASELPQHIQHHGSGSLGTLSNGYGRSSDDAETGEEMEMSTGGASSEATTAAMEEDQVRQMRSMQFASTADNERNSVASDNYVEPEFPWNRVMELQDALGLNPNN